MNAPDLSKVNLNLIGVKPPESKAHSYGRIIVVGCLIGIIAWGIYSENQETTDLEDLSDIIKADSIMYSEIMELDDVHRKKYVRMLKRAFDNDRESVFSRYYKSLTVALITSICSEYIINGNLTKPLRGVGRTVVATAWQGALT